MNKSKFAAFVLLVAAGLVGGAHAAVGQQSQGAPAVTVTESAAPSDAHASPFGDSGWS
jgi:hypothetical protein